MSPFLIPLLILAYLVARAIDRRIQLIEQDYRVRRQMRLHGQAMGLRNGTPQTPQAIKGQT